MGLAALLGIVKAHRGGIKLKSSLNQGTIVTIYFPVYVDVSVDKEGGRQGYLNHKAEKGIVLLVDDDESVRNVGKEMLESIGFRVITASDGQDAIDVFANYKDEIQCVLLDHAMPKMDGVEAFEGIRKIKKM